MAGRLSKEDKGKSLASDYHQAPRKPTIKAKAPDTSALNHKFSLTLIGRVTNQSTQKIWALIPFFTELWKTDRRPVGSDLGNGLFQFQFERETDLISVLEKRPYHYAKWMVIVQRWEPTVSRDFPSLLPFWIKVQGIPIHLWAEETIQDLGENLGLFESMEITQTGVKMRVQVNGLLPLIKSSVIEYSNGDEVTATFVYEKLERHCSKCSRLDHEVKDCLVAKHQDREAKAQENQRRAISEANEPPGNETKQRTESNIYHFSASNPNGEDHHRRSRSQYSREYRYDARHSLEERRRYRSSQDTVNRRQFRDGSKDRPGSYGSRSSYYKDLDHQNREVSSRHQREEYRQQEKTNMSPTRRGRTESRRAEGGAARETEEHPTRNEALNDQQQTGPREALSEAIEEVREAMLQYTKCADPTESAARRERMRKAEEEGELEETALLMIQANQDKAAMEEELPQDMKTSAERIPAILRLGPSPIAVSEATAVPEKKKLGRPPGRRRVHQSPRLIKGSNSKKRKTLQTKPPTVRRKLNTDDAVDTRQRGRARQSNSREAGNSAASSDNQPICNMIPSRSKKKTDFRNPSTLAP